MRIKKIGKLLLIAVIVQAILSLLSIGYTYSQTDPTSCTGNEALCANINESLWSNERVFITGAAIILAFYTLYAILAYIAYKKDSFKTYVFVAVIAAVGAFNATTALLNSGQEITIFTIANVLMGVVILALAIVGIKTIQNKK